MPQYPEIRLTGCQIKSLEKARVVAAALHTLEVETGIKVCRVNLVNCFICPDIDEAALDTLNQTPMERVLQTIIREIRSQR
ncbi:MAG: hypothetical protein AABN95_15955 [Acidobacteriota bacterium]